MHGQTEEARAGWPLRAWCASANVSVATYYTLKDGIRPKSVKLGKRRIIIEAPADWLRRMAEAEGRK